MSAASRFQYPQCASVTYVVIPTTGLATLEHPLPLVARHGLVEQLLLGARVVEVMVDDLVAEQRARNRALLEARDRLAQRMREALRVGDVRVTLERRPELELVLDPVQPGGEQRRECEVRVRVRARDARLRAQRRSLADDAEAARAVVVSPGERRRRPAPGGEALVRVDRRRDEDCEIGRMPDLAREVVLEDVRLAREDGLAVLPQRRVDVT